MNWLEAKSFYYTIDRTGKFTCKQRGCNRVATRRVTIAFGRDETLCTCACAAHADELQDLCTNAEVKFDLRV